MKNLTQPPEEVLEADLGIYRVALITMHSGNASGIDRDSGIVIIKPSGMDYEKLSAALLVATDLHECKLETGEPGDR
jgi:L-ribulose-5-phosphate 4-epimerase